jgi:hypothetical protein
MYFSGIFMGKDGAVLYKLDRKRRWEDRSDVYASGAQSHLHQWVLCSESGYDQAKGLPDKIPFALLKEKETVLGMRAAST